MRAGTDRAAQAGANGRAYLLLTFTTLCWGANAVFGKLAVGEISPMALVTARWLGASLLLALFAHNHLRRDWRLLRPHLLFLSAMGVLGFTAFNALFYVAAHYTTAVNIGIIQGSMPVFVLIGAFAAYRTRVTALQIAGVIVTMLGVVIVGSGGDPARLAALAVNPGDVLMVAACALYAGYTVGLRKRPQVSSLSLLAVLACAAFLTSLPLTLAEAALSGHPVSVLSGAALLHPGRDADRTRPRRHLRQPGAGVRVDPRGGLPQRALRGLSRARAGPRPRRNLAVRARQGDVTSSPVPRAALKPPGRSSRQVSCATNSSRARR
jgi:drug/metabolite transporter (DMT)-like permease